ncbi:MAG: biotin--[acetyl-CoA-carboxylase] ligase, partial [Actinomycetia bacterium]|nr:biotin--[acetyl-CoA-carboxylase] ligase [Actinomycetes bacterium]
YKGKFISGENMAKKLGISRAAVWKHINILKREGYRIDSIPQRGYRLTAIPDCMNAYELKDSIGSDIFGNKIFYFNKIDSTQNYAKALASKDFPEGTVVVAESQGIGRGRLGREWVSPPGGIWFSFIIRPYIAPRNAGIIPLLSALSIVQSLREMDITTRIKWPNDIYLNQKKIAGVLVESEIEQDKIHWIVVGVGINANFKKSKLKNIPGASTILEETKKKISRLNFLKSFFLNFKIYYDKLITEGSGEIINEVKECIMFLNEKVKLKAINKEVEGRLIAITDIGEIVIKLKEKEELTFSSGELQQMLTG